MPRSRPALKLVLVEGEEVRALLALDVDDLDVLALLDLVGQRRGLVHAEVEPRLGQRRRQLELDLLARPPAVPPPPAPRPARVSVHEAARPGRHHGQQHVALDSRTTVRRPGAAVPANSRSARASCGRSPRACSMPTKPSPPLFATSPRTTLASASAVAPSAARSSRPSDASAVSSATWPPSGSITVTPVARAQLHDRSRPRAHPPALEAAVDRLEAGDQRWWARPQVHVFGPAPWPRPCRPARTSCLARSRLAAASSFLTSFSTTLRLYVWFQ